MEKIVSSSSAARSSAGARSQSETEYSSARSATYGRPIVIEDKVWIGINTTILPGVRIGYGAIVGAQSVVTHDVPPMTIVAGNPARVIKTIEQ